MTGQGYGAAQDVSQPCTGEAIVCDGDVMTYDTAVWTHSGPITDDAATEEFERRCDESDDRFPEQLPAAPGLQRLISLVEAHFASDPPWEDAPNEAVDGDFLYLTMSSDGGSDVEAFMARHAAECGVVVYSPLSEGVVQPDQA